MLKTGLKTREFWLTALGLAGAVASQFIPGLPTEAIVAVASWTLTRGLEKFLAPTGAAAKPAWQTTEFWAMLIYGGAASAFPELPKESIALLWAYLGSRLAAKKGAAG